ncbi:MAG TPA: hypothetical protein VHV54_20960 [Candidatus Binatia bacterium]|nr:hypothetical protein [Candidatus Binatia bacterium]
MQLLRVADVPITGQDRVYRYSRARALSAFLIFCVLAVASLAFGWFKSMWLAYYITAAGFLFLLIFQKLITARFRPTNWLVRMTDHGLYIKFRSYLNHHFPEQDPTVLFLPYSELCSARLVKERQEVPDLGDGRNSPMTKTRRLLVLELARESTELAAVLDNERKRVFSKMNQGGGAKSRYHHLPVRLASPNLLTIEWGVVPSVQSILDALTRHTLVRRGEEVAKDFVNLDGLSREKQEERLLELAESGDMMGAVAMARQLYSYDLATAKTFVESLVHKAAKPVRDG